MQTTKNDWIKLVDKFIPHPDFDVTDYYGVSIIKTKGTNRYRVKLIHDYKHNAIMSKNQLEFSSLKTALKAYAILDKHARDKGEINNIDNIFDEEPDDENEEKEDNLPW